MCNSPELSNKTEYPTFARTLAVHNKILPTILAILNEFSWDKVAIVTERKDQFIGTTQYMKKEFKKNGIKLTYSAEIQDLREYENYLLFNNTKYEKEYKNAIQHIKKEARSKWTLHLSNMYPCIIVPVSTILLRYQYVSCYCAPVKYVPSDCGTNTYDPTVFL